MNNILENFEKDHMQQLMSGKTYPEFNSGDTLKVHLKVKEGEKERIQVFEGVCIAKKKCWCELIIYCKKNFLWRRNRKSFALLFSSNKQNRSC